MKRICVTESEELDISHQALSERFRRATGTMVENGLLVGQRSPRPTNEDGQEQWTPRASDKATPSTLE